MDAVEHREVIVDKLTQTSEFIGVSRQHRDLSPKAEKLRIIEQIVKQSENKESLEAKNQTHLNTVHLNYMLDL